MTLKGLIKLVTKPRIFIRDYKKKRKNNTIEAIKKIKKETLKDSASKSDKKMIMQVKEAKITKEENKKGTDVNSSLKKDTAKIPTKKEIKMGVMDKLKTIITTATNNIPVANASLELYEVALYFAGGMGNIYQVEQWVDTLKELHKVKKVVIITRIKDVFEWLVKNTNFTIAYCKTIDDLTNLYEQSNFKCVLYVNNGFKNFQSLMVGNALHIHINHGESDKTSTISNQSKAYDYVYIVGEAAYDKYKLNLIKKDMDKFIEVGRPQLDHIKRVKLLNEEELYVNSYEHGIEEKKRRKVILYAPTWEGTHDSMNFSSLDEYGMSIVQQVVNNPNYYLIYKPHPNTGSRLASTKNTNNTIIKLLEKTDNAKVVLDGDINSIYEHIDLAIFDNSAVAIDYLLADKPMLMTDLFHRVRDRQSKPTITKAACMLQNNDIFNLYSIIEREIEHDTLKVPRSIIKRYFLGDFDYSKKESTQKFINEILNAIKERDEAVKSLIELNNSHLGIDSKL